MRYKQSTSTTSCALCTNMIVFEQQSTCNQNKKKKTEIWKALELLRISKMKQIGRKSNLFLCKKNKNISNNVTVNH